MMTGQQLENDKGTSRVRKQKKSLKMLSARLLRDFKLQAKVASFLQLWERKMTELIEFGLAPEQWSSEVYLLYVHCQASRLPEFASFDPDNQFNGLMEKWRQFVIRCHVNRRERLREEDDTSYLSLSKLLLEHLNLNSCCKTNLRILEKNLRYQITVGTKLEYALTQVRSFCRSNTAPVGVYDQNGLLESLVSRWYATVMDSFHPPSVIAISYDGKDDIDVMLKEIGQLTIPMDDTE